MGGKNLGEFAYRGIVAAHLTYIVNCFPYRKGGVSPSYMVTKSGIFFKITARENLLSPFSRSSLSLRSGEYFSAERDSHLGRIVPSFALVGWFVMLNYWFNPPSYFLIFFLGGRL